MGALRRAPLDGLKWAAATARRVEYTYTGDGSVLQMRVNGDLVLRRESAMAGVSAFEVVAVYERHTQYRGCLAARAVMAGRKGVQRLVKAWVWEAEPSRSHLLYLLKEGMGEQFDEAAACALFLPLLSAPEPAAPKASDTFTLSPELR